MKSGGLKMLKDKIGNKQFNMLKSYIDTLNSMVKILKENNIHIRDNDDFDYAIEYVYYSEGQDEVIAKFKEVEQDEI